MFTTHFKMTRHPFCERTPVEGILKDERISQGLARLEYLASEGTIALLTGPTGVGKSSLLKLFLSSLSRNQFHPLYLHLTHLSSGAFLKLIVARLGEVPRRGKETLFLQILEKAKAGELSTLLLVDEAHLLDPDALTDLRLLVSSALEEVPPFKIILAGQDSLRDQLKRSVHGDLVQRISVRYQLPPLTKDQTEAYIDFQMRQAGASQKIFEPEVKSLIHDYAGGIPRQINNLATACLIQAAARNTQKVQEPLFHETLVEFQLP